MGQLQKIVLVVVAFVVVLCVLWAAIFSKWQEREAIAAEVTRLEQEIQRFDAKIATRAERRQHRDAIDDVFNELIEILPRASARQQERVLEALTAYAGESRIVFKGLAQRVEEGAKPGVPPSGPQPQAAPQRIGDFERTEIAARFEGTFENFVRFLSKVENNPSFLKVDEIKLEPIPGVTTDPRPLAIFVRISTFQYLGQ